MKGSLLLPTARVLAMGLMVSLLANCQRIAEVEGPENGADSKPAAPSELPQKMLTGAIEMPTKRCADIFHQTGQGCDPEGAKRVLDTLRQPGGPVATCYRGSLQAPKTGTIRFRITLAPDGGVADVETLEDGFAGTPLASCLIGAVRELRFPAPGDVPCVLLHTFPFVSQEKKK